jgi:hypothetical protein
MATRFYYESDATTALEPNQANPTLTPAYDAAWGVTGEAVRRWLTTSSARLSTPIADTTWVDEFETAATDVLVAQFISAPLAGSQTIDGTVKGQIRARETLAGDDRAQIVIRVVSNDGATVRGTLLAADASALSSEFDPSNVVNRKFPLASSSPATLTGVNPQAGDRLVVEIGFRAHDTTGQSAVYMKFGSGAASDLAEDETSQADNNPWLEFSDTITFLTDDIDLGVPIQVTQEWVDVAVSDATPEIQVTQEWTDVGIKHPTPEVQVTEIWIEVAFKRDYVYLDGTILVDDIHEDLDNFSD